MSGLAYQKRGEWPLFKERSLCDYVDKYASFTKVRRTSTEFRFLCSRGGGNDDSAEIASPRYFGFIFCPIALIS